MHQFVVLWVLKIHGRFNRINSMDWLWHKDIIVNLRLRIQKKIVEQPGMRLPRWNNNRTSFIQFGPVLILKLLRSCTILLQRKSLRYGELKILSRNIMACFDILGIFNNRCIKNRVLYNCGNLIFLCLYKIQLQICSSPVFKSQDGGPQSYSSAYAKNLQFTAQVFLRTVQDIFLQISALSRSTTIFL